jgi:3',5'-cyclic AMP phosphodiesterase CpdA
MRPIVWLHLSDLHLKASDVWSQDIVLKAMCGDIDRMRRDGVRFDFILISGDLAFSGGATEYGLVETFVDALCRAAGVPKESVFTIPGNHDVDRSRQKMCFAGVRHILQSQSHVDAFLGSS